MPSSRGSHHKKGRKGGREEEKVLLWKTPLPSEARLVASTGRLTYSSTLSLSIFFHEVLLPLSVISEISLFPIPLLLTFSTHGITI